MKFQAPAESASIGALTRAVEAEGFDVQAFRRLLYLINAHPTLNAHGQVFANLAAFLGSSVMSAENLKWAGPWKRDLPAWKSICRWIGSNSVRLAQANSDLEPLAVVPRRANDNPHLRRGVTRHAVVAALWMRHENSPAYPPPPDDRIATAYFHLQAHLLAAYCESRFRVEERWPERGQIGWEAYSGEREFPAAPCLTGPVGLAIRELSHAKHGSHLAEIPLDQPTRNVASALPNWDAYENRKSPIAFHLTAIVRFFRSFSRLIWGSLPNQNKRQGGGGGWGHGRRPGHIHHDEVAGVYLGRADPKPDDSDIPWRLGRPLLVDLDPDLVEAEDELWDSGLSPDETKEELGALYEPEALKRKFVENRRQRLAIEAHAQHLPFDLVILTDTELRRLWRLLDDLISRYLDGQASNQSVARIEAASALMLKLSLTTGIGVEYLRSAKLLVTQDASEIPEPDGGTDRFHVLMAGADQAIEDASPLGFLIPAIAPHYKRDPDPALAPLNRERATHVFVPDAFNVVREIKTFYLKSGRPNETIFGLEPQTAEQSVKAILKRLEESRITREKIARQIPELIVRLNRDLPLAWCATADERRCSEPRLYYAQYTTGQLVDSYLQAASDLTRRLGLAPHDAPRAAVDRTQSVGARFVARTDKLAELVGHVKEAIRSDIPIILHGESITRYHHDYLLYTWLYQSLTTSIRAIRNPGSLLLQFERQPGGITPCPAALSDKDGRFSEKSRLAWINDGLGQQFRNHLAHVQAVVRQLGLRRQWNSDACDFKTFFVIERRGQLRPLTPKWVQEQLSEKGFPAPANFHRAFLRTELIERGSPGEVVDAFLGHARLGESPFGTHSSFDYHAFTDSILNAITAIHRDIGLEPIGSQLIPHAARRHGHAA